MDNYINWDLRGRLVPLNMFNLIAPFIQNDKDSWRQDELVQSITNDDYVFEIPVKVEP